MRTKHFCSHCRHDPETVMAQLVGMDFLHDREVPKHKAEIEIPAMDADLVAATVTESAPFESNLYTLVFERYKPKDPQGLIWQFRFRGVRNRG